MTPFFLRTLAARLVRPLVSALLLTTLAAPALAQVSDPPRPADAAAPKIYDPNDYKLGPGDKIRIIVYNEATLSGEFIIAPSGLLSFPLVGDIEAGDKTVGSLQRALEARLKAGYLRDPHISVEVLTFRPFYILGEVNKPGEYPYTAGLTVTKAVATAQGYTYRANSKRVFIKHASDDVERPYTMSNLTPLAPGDIIRIPERHF